MSQEILKLLFEALLDTTYMVAVSAFISTVVGLPLGILLVTTARNHILENVYINKIADTIVNATRSIPFIILLVAIIPVTRMIVGTSIGTNAAIVPLTLACIPYIARIVQSAIIDVDHGLIEAAQSMGATPLQIVLKILIPEALPTIILGLTLAIVSLIGCSAMAGAIGGGGLGDLAIRYGYQRFRGDVMLATVLILIVQVQLVQTCGNFIAHKLTRK